MQLNYLIVLSLCELQQPYLTVKGCIGSQIVLIEVLWRRVHADPNSDILPNEREVRHITKKIPDFKD